MATPNYGYEKRQKELAKKRKKEDKLKAKAERRTDGLRDASSTADGQVPPGLDGEVSGPDDAAHAA